MLLPALNRARASARQSQCISNIRQLYQCESNYMSDFNGWLPFRGEGIRVDNYNFGDTTVAGDTLYGPAILFYAKYITQPYIGFCPLAHESVANIAARIRSRSWSGLSQNMYSIIVYRYGKDESGVEFSKSGYTKNGQFSNSVVLPWINSYRNPSSRIINIDTNRKLDDGLFKPSAYMPDSMTNPNWSSFASSTDSTALPYAGHNNNISINRADGSAGCINPRLLRRHYVFFYRTANGDRFNM